MPEPVEVLEKKAKEIWALRSEVPKFKEEVQKLTKEQLKALDELINLAGKEKDPPPKEVVTILDEKLQELEKIAGDAELTKKLAELETRADMVKLLERIKPPTPSRFEKFKEKVEEYLTPAIKAMKEMPIIGSVIAFFGEDVPKIAKNIGRWLEKAFYYALSSPSLLGIDPKTPLIGNVVNWAKDRLDRLNAVDAIQAAVDAEKEAPSQNTITFDRKISERAWMKLKPEDRDPAKLQQRTLEHIAELRKADPKNGTPEQPIAVTLDTLVDRETAKKEADAKRLEELKTKVINHGQWKKAGVKAVTFGEAISATKGAEGWSLTVPEAQVDPDGKPKLPEATKLSEVLPKLTNAKEVAITKLNSPLEIEKGGKLRLPVSATVDPVALDKALSIDKPRISILRVTTDDTLAMNVVQFSLQDGRGILTWNARTDFIQVIDRLNEIDANAVAGDKATWKWDDTAKKWVLSP
jgi:hypothetical protein